MSDLDKFFQKFGGVSEPYFFYDGTVELRYAPKEHEYLEVVADGTLEERSGVTHTCHIVDKSQVLMPWACKMMAQKLLNTLPWSTLESGKRVLNADYDEIEKIILESKDAHTERLTEAGDIGKIAHNWIEAYIKCLIANDEEGQQNLLCNMPVDERAYNCATAGLRWIRAHNVRFTLTERKIYSKRHKYAGTLDGEALVDSCDDPSCCPHKFKDRLAIIDWKTSNYLYIEYLLQTAAYSEAEMEEFGKLITDRFIIRLGKEDAEFDPWHLEAETLQQDFECFLTCQKLRQQYDAIEERMRLMKLDRTATRRAAKKAAKEAAEAVEKAEKARLKAEAKAAKEAALKLECKNFKNYKGLRKPTCGCEACEKKFVEIQQNKLAIAQPEKLVKTRKKKEKPTKEQLINSLELLIGGPKVEPKEQLLLTDGATNTCTALTLSGIKAEINAIAQGFSIGCHVF
jgi:hypothetical protein